MDNENPMEIPLWEELCEWFKKWPEYSGDDAFPVPGPNPKEHPEAYRKDCFYYRHARYAEAAFIQALAQKSMWIGAYGQKRLELLDWLIEQTKG